MKIIRGIELKQGSQEELLPDFSPEFPYIASFVELHKYIGRQSPWHWHKEVELFYMKDGELEYDTPHGKKSYVTDQLKKESAPDPLPASVPGEALR